MKFIILLVLVLVILAGCSKSPTAPNSESELLVNPNFDLNGAPSFNGWTVVDSSVIQFSTDAPNGGSGHTMALHFLSWLPLIQGTIYQGVPAQVGTHAYRLSFFSKTNGPSQGAGLTLNSPSNNRWKIFDEA